MPHKHNARKRHHIPKAKYTVTNWPQYEAGLKQRGSLTLWMTPEATELWKASARTSPGGQARYSDLAIQTCLMLRTAFRIPLRQAEGLMASVFTLMKVSLNVPDHTTVSRRAAVLPPLPSILSEGDLHILIDSTGLKVYGAGQWLEEKHGVRARRDWRKLHLAVDADNFSIVAHTLTDSHTDDPSQEGPLLSQTEGTVTQVTADGAYDGRPTYNTIAGHGEGITVAIPPRVTAVPEETTGPPCQRDRHLAMIQEKGLLAWQKAVGYGKRALVETMMACWKTLIGSRLRTRGFAAQQTEAAIGVAVLNRLLSVARPHSVRRQVRSA
ncbi:TPA: IS5 family transposase [Enterobacter hormaechei]